MRGTRNALMLFVLAGGLLLSAPLPAHAYDCPEDGACPFQPGCVGLCVYDHCECLKNCWNECCETDCQDQSYANCQTDCDNFFYNFCLPPCPF
jgi:hypothetical protein